MKLSEQLQTDHNSGDFGEALEGYADKAKQLEDALQSVFDDSCSWPEGKIKKSTILKVMPLVNRSA